jgi:uncharacterized membrane protein YqjE
MVEESRAAEGGLFESLKALSSSLIGIVHTRLELLATDVSEEREHLTAWLVWMLAALFCLGVGMVLLAILIVAVFWESHRFMALGGLTGFFLAVGTGVGWFARYRLRTKPRLFASSLAELSKDRQQLGPGS